MTMTLLDPSSRHRVSRGTPRARRPGGLRTASAFMLWAALACSERPEVSEGQRLYEGTCQQCHGVGGHGDGPMASSLPTQPANLLEHLAHHTRNQLVTLVTGGIPPGMPPQPLTPEQVDLVVEYIWTFVPASEVEALRAMQQQMEMMGDPGMGGMPGMSGMPGTGADTAAAMPGMNH